MRKTCKNARKKRKIALSVGICHLNSGYRKAWRNDLKINFPQHWKVQASRHLRSIVCPSVKHTLKPTVEKFQNTGYTEKNWRAWDPQNGWRENKERRREGRMPGGLSTSLPKLTTENSGLNKFSMWGQTKDVSTHAVFPKIYPSCTVSQQAVWLWVPSNSRISNTWKTLVTKCLLSEREFAF